MVTPAGRKWKITGHMRIELQNKTLSVSSVVFSSISSHLWRKENDIISFYIIITLLNQPMIHR